jgi:hypothetical protein
MNPTDTPKPGETPRTLAFLRLLSMLPSGSYEQFMELVEIHFGQLEREIAELQRDKSAAERRAAIWMSMVHGLPNDVNARFQEAAERHDRAMQPKEETKPCS